jgi:indole-3-glycerol phosphate synthase
LSGVSEGLEEVVCVLVINNVLGEDLFMEFVWVALSLGVAVSVTVEETCWLKIAVGKTIELINTGEAIRSLGNEVAISV